MANRPTRVYLAIETGSDPIRGSVVIPPRDPRPFSGWIDLTEKLEADRAAGGSDLAGERAARPATPGLGGPKD